MARGDRRGQDAVLRLCPGAAGSTRDPPAAGHHEQVGRGPENAVDADRQSVRHADTLGLDERDELDREAPSGEDLERRDRVEFVAAVADEDLNLSHDVDLAGLRVRQRVCRGVAKRRAARACGVDHELDVGLDLGVGAQLAGSGAAQVDRADVSAYARRAWRRAPASSSLASRYRRSRVASRARDAREHGRAARVRRRGERAGGGGPAAADRHQERDGPAVRPSLGVRHNRYRRVIATVSIEERVMPIGPHPDCSVRAAAIGDSGVFLTRTVTVVGHALATILGPRWFFDRFNPTFHALNDLLRRMPIDSQSLASWTAEGQPLSQADPVALRSATEHRRRHRRRSGLGILDRQSPAVALLAVLAARSLPPRPRAHVPEAADQGELARRAKRSSARRKPGGRGLHLRDNPPRPRARPPGSGTGA